LGEQLHLHSEPRKALEYLTTVLQIRFNLPAVHARLAFIALEQLDLALAASHFEHVLATRESGQLDSDMSPQTRAATMSWYPFISLFLATPSSATGARLEILERALTQYPTEITLQLLRAVTVRELQRTPVKSTIATLQDFESRLKTRVDRFREEGDHEAMGLWALTLLGLNKVKEADRVHEAFWVEAKRVVDERKGGAAGATLVDAEKCRRLTLLRALHQDLSTGRVVTKVKKERSASSAD
jgi:hypothetical protein